MASSHRSANYMAAEDELLCRIYIDISQCPIIGINQSGDAFYDRILAEYNKAKEEHWPQRNRRSLQCRMGLITKAMGKLRGAIRQIENLNRSGASELDIVSTC